MIKRSVALAVLATLASGAALAQSSVTLYGRLNTTLERQKTGSTTLNVLQNNASRLGFKGEEDLGSGLKAGFVLEHGFGVDNGAAAAPFWGRQAEVNLTSAYGMVRLGTFGSEAQLATGDWVGMHNHDTGTSADALYAYVIRDTNKVSYRTPTIKGLTGELGVSLGEGAGARAYDLAANYEMGAIKLGAGYAKLDTAHQFSARALYEMGAVTLAGYLQRDKNGIAAGSRTSGRLAAMYTMGASEFHANLGFAGKIGGAANTQATQATLGYNYNLSQRTKVYAFYTRVNNKAAASYMTGANGVDFSSLAAGVRHNF
jgi:predicted porin